MSSMVEIVPERRIKEAAKHLAGEPNSFSALLDLGKQYRSADLTPIYLFDRSTAEIYVTSKEKVSGKFH